MNDLIDREQAKDAIDKYLVGRNLVTDGTMMARLINEIVIDRLPSAQPTFDARDTQYNLPIGTDLISRQALLDKFEPWLKVKDYNDGELNMLKAILYEIRFMPSAQPEQRYTEEELRVFKHGISLSLLSKRSAQHWRYDEDMATEIKFLERLYDKVVADMEGEQDG